jgi:predicted RNase H-like HicB family nuclease
MERVIQLHIGKLPEGVYLATSDDVQGLVAQGRTIQETLEIARDVAKKLIEAQSSARGAIAGRRDVRLSSDRCGLMSALRWAPWRAFATGTSSGA